MTTSVPLHAIPIPSRPRPTLSDRLRVLAFNLTFLVYLVFAHTFQLLFLPFLLLSIITSFLSSQEPFKSIKHSSREVFRLGIKWTKEIFASILIAIVRLFGRTKLVVTANSRQELEALVSRDEEGNVKGFRIDKHSVWMSNHQCYVDWIMIWLVMAFGEVSEGITIILKHSLKWVPLVGPAMQLFRFVFLSRAKPLSESTMYETARDSVERDDPFQLVIYPEGTLYSRLTRPKSKAFAQAQGIPDMEYTLLPRSTGLLYTLRLLSTLFPSAEPSATATNGSADSKTSNTTLSTTRTRSLTLYDLTIGYAGVKPREYAQSYISLQSWFGRGIPPPTVHLHFERLRVDPRSIPIGEVRQSARPKHIETEITDSDRKEFERWIFDRWNKKDERMGRFKADGRGFEEEEREGGKVEFEIEMRKGDWVRLTSVPIGLTVFYFLVGYVVTSVLTKWRS